MDLLDLKDAIPQAQAAGEKLVADLQKTADETVSRAQAAIEGAAAKATAELAGLLAQQDGWTLTITVPPITIPPITIRLNKPQPTT